MEATEVEKRQRQEHRSWEGRNEHCLQLDTFMNCIESMFVNDELQGIHWHNLF
jgi:hypothetical protein